MKYFLFFGLVFLLFISGCTNVPLCGNQICERGEDEFSCPADCSLEAKGCTDLGGFVCQKTDLCSADEIDVSDVFLCCSVKCELPEPPEIVKHECDNDFDCDDKDDKTNDFCDGFPRKCVNSIKSCFQIEGQSGKFGIKIEPLSRQIFGDEHITPPCS